MQNNAILFICFINASENKEMINHTQFYDLRFNIELKKQKKFFFPLDLNPFL